MQNDNFTPVNKLELMLTKAQDGTIPLEEFLEALMQLELHVPSETEVSEDRSGFSPMLLTKNDNNFIGVFTTRERIEKVAPQFTFCLSIPHGSEALKWLRTIAPNCGILINPGFYAGLEISPDGMDGIIRDFGTDAS
ncbi:MAG: SseB family protein [Candidatus Obscuribacterales bacterium]|nr:SseB family protein [Candidatus Obscuribacterales bacterium]